MNYSVKIRNNKTGEIRLVNTKWDWDDSQLFWWQEGNASCDCNRAIFFYDNNNPEVECDCNTQTQQFHVLCAVLEDGTEVSVDDLKSVAVNG